MPAKKKAKLKSLTIPKELRAGVRAIQKRAKEPRVIFTATATQNENGFALEVTIDGRVFGTTWRMTTPGAWRSKPRGAEKESGFAERVAEETLVDVDQVDDFLGHLAGFGFDWCRGRVTPTGEK